jgi:hypothetical protein
VRDLCGKEEERTKEKGAYGEVFEKDDADPVGHAMGSWPSEVPVDDYDGDQNREGVHNKGEEEVLGDEREDKGCRRKDLGHLV